MNRQYFHTDEPSVIGDPNAIAAYEQATGTKLKAISLVEWQYTHKDFKSVSCGINPDIPAGIPTVMDYDKGTVLRLVKVIRTEDSVRKKETQFQAEIHTLEEDLEWAKKYEDDPTYDAYRNHLKEKVAAAQAEIVKVSNMRPLFA